MEDPGEKNMVNTACATRPAVRDVIHSFRAGTKKLKDKATALALTGLLAVEMAPVYATDAGTGTSDIPDVTIAQDVDTAAIFGKLLGIVIWITRFIGAFLLLWGIVMFALSLKNDEPESKTKASMSFAAGAVLLALETILKAAGIIS